MKTSRKVLCLDPSGLLWGSERAMLDFIGEVPGYEFGCCVPPNSPLIGMLKQRNITVLPYFVAELHKKGKPSRLLAMLGLVRAILIYRPDILHVNQAGATKIALAATRLLGVPVISHVRLLDDATYLNQLAPKAERLRHLIAVSDPIRERLRGQPNLLQIRCTAVLDAYRSKGQERTASYRVKEWDFLCIGRFCSNKGQHLLIEAIAAIHRMGGSPRVAFAGELNAVAEKMQALCINFGISEYVVFLGHVEDMGSQIVKAKWLACPSDYESLGRVVFEAWDYGIPVIAGAFSGGAAASVRASGGGLLFDEWTAESLAATLELALALDVSEVSAMADAGRAWMVPTTDPVRYARKLSSIYDSVLTS